MEIIKKKSSFKNFPAINSIATDETIKLNSNNVNDIQTKCNNNDAINLNINNNNNVNFNDKLSFNSSETIGESIDIEFNNLSYNVKLGYKKGAKTILQNVSGKFLGNQLITIMGPSGAGKSSLLDVLSGYRTTGVTESILVNGIERNLKTFKKKSCYITQDDRLQTLLTVKENMEIVADLKLGPKCQDKINKVKEILHLLGLYDHKDTLTSQLSGGQKKRLSIALELINNPTIMFLDEPTTGLDSYSCQRVIDLLKQLAQQGRTIICTIHQPTAKLFQSFDHVYVLSSGRCVYQGSPSKMIQYLDSVHLPCPLYHNPADYIIELACEEYGTDKVNTLSNAMQNGKTITWLDKQKPNKLSSHTIVSNKYTEKAAFNNLEDTTFWYQFLTLSKRGLIKSKRDTTLTHLRIRVNLFVALVLGLLYLKSGNEGSRIIDNYNLLFAIIIHNGCSGMMLTVLTFPMELEILKKEIFNRYYSLKSYFLSLTLLELPVSFICCFLFSIILYFLSSQPMDLVRFSKFFGISMVLVLVGQAGGLIIGAFASIVNGVFFAPVINVPLLMFAGHTVNLRDLPYYLKWGSHISYLRYGLEGYVSSIYGDNRERLDCNLASYCHYRYPKKFLHEIAMSGDRYWISFGALALNLILFRTVAYYSLKYKINATK